ncbi:hypothetical protein [Variovorax sp. WS11]|uniref:hypothetical protein n=1 Tax=Variovorax sp. WS11 TaxID=1105204 RepID=UPI0013DBB36D|nr:hypothetical protein [Variovorax sp. WS11]NDZ13608.1 hypothetical protein [Variovorax sp. WS11]
MKKPIQTRRMTMVANGATVVSIRTRQVVVGPDILLRDIRKRCAAIGKSVAAGATMALLIACTALWREVPIRFVVVN